MRAQLKTLAKSQIRGNIGVLFVIMLVTMAISALPNVIPGIGMIISLLVAGPLCWAEAYIYLRLTDGRKPEVADVF